jgi:OOP family OmpA-OmpF porin
MNRTTLAILALAGAALSPVAFAQGYAGGSIGQSRADLDCSGTTTCDKTDTAFKLFGGYMFTPNLGVEGAYYNQGKAKLAGTDPTLGNVTATYKGDGLGAFVLGVAPFDRYSVFGKVGLVSAKIKVDATSSVFGSGSDSERHTNIGWGVGAGYEFTKNLGARLEFERIRVEFAGDKTDADLITLGVLYRF